VSPARARALFGAVALAAATGYWSGPGAAPASAYVCSLSITSPRSNPPIGTSSARFSGAFAAAPSSTGRTVQVSFLASPGPRPTVAQTDDRSWGPDSYAVDVGGLSLNGTYRAQVKAIHDASPVLNCQGGLGGARPKSATAEVTFGVSVRARPPVNVASRFEAGPRTAVVTWERSPDPDTAGYSLSRKVGTGGFEPMGAVHGDVLSWTDPSLPAEAATATYAVTSSRNGPVANSTSEASDPVAAAPLEVPGPPPAPTTSTTLIGAVGTETPSGDQRPRPGAPDRIATTPTSKPFVLARPVPGSPSPAAVDFPDSLINPEAAQAADGDQPALQYRPNRGLDQVQLVEEDGQAFAAGRGGPGDQDTPQLAYVAAGLLSAVVAAHVLWLRGQALRPAAGPTEVGLPVEPLAPARPAEPTRTDPPAPTPAGPARPILVIRSIRGGRSEPGAER